MLLWPGTMAAVNADTENSEGAQEFIEYITSDEGNNTWIDAAGGSEMSVSSFMDPSTWEGCYADQVEYAETAVMIPVITWPSAATSNALGEGVAGILAGVSTVDDVLASMDAAWTE